MVEIGCDEIELMDWRLEWNRLDIYEKLNGLMGYQQICGWVDFPASSSKPCLSGLWKHNFELTLHVTLHLGVEVHGVLGIFGDAPGNFSRSLTRTENSSACCWERCIGPPAAALARHDHQAALILGALAPISYCCRCFLDFDVLFCFVQKGNTGNRYWSLLNLIAAAHRKTGQNLFRTCLRPL